MRFLIRIYGARGDYSAMVPDLPGCVAVAETVEKVRNLMAEAVTLHLDLMRRSGETIPEPARHLDFAIDETSEVEFCTWVEVEEPVLSGRKEVAGRPRKVRKPR